MSYTYTAVPGFFVQDVPGADPAAIGALPPHFGLADASDTRWANLRAEIARLNAEADPGTSYKLLILARHGQGFHNVAEAKYGTRLWDEHYAMLYTDGEIVWGPDPLLTPRGEAQARAAHDAWAAARTGADPAPLPQRVYSSPLTRALHTCALTLDGVVSATAAILEDLREECGAHTCDQRRTRSAIAAAFPRAPAPGGTVGFAAEDGLTEADELWTPTREAWAHVVGRARRVLDRVFREDAEYVSITAHGGIINALLEAAGRPRYALPTGGVLPVVVRGVLG